MVRNDIDQVIFNPDELGEIINFNGQTLLAIKDSTATVQLGGKETPGLLTADLVLYIKRKDLPAPIAPDMTVTVDGVKYRVSNVNGEQVLQLILQKVVSRSANYGGRAGMGRY